jgi:signal transduction histidine kinase
MFNTLYAKLAAGLAVLLVLIGVLYASISELATRRALEQLNQQLNRNLAKSLVADRNLVADGKLNQAALKKTFQLYMSINPSLEIYLLDLEGKLLSFSADAKKIKRNKVSLAPIEKFLKMKSPYPLLGDDPRSHDRQKAFSVARIPSDDKPEGYLYVVLRGEQFDEAEAMVRGSYFTRMSAIAVIASLTLGLVAGLIVFHLLTRWLRRLSTSMALFERTALTGPIPPPDQMDPKSGDEIDMLSATFDAMAQRILDQIDALTEKDALRRNLVAQISHDLRTPLAAVRGYMESLQMKGDKLTAAERKTFLEGALRQGRHLSRLVDDLFELASLDAREQPPELEPFAMAELVHDVVQKHALTAKQAGNKLEAKQIDENVFAVGNIQLTERVLDNLLDNALSHAPKRGKVTISLSRDGAMLTVGVHNGGKPIPQVELGHIFEPFYQGQDRAQKPGHAGLGLAIAKRIMDLQNGEIRAESAPRKGTTFTFALPMAAV